MNKLKLTIFICLAVICIGVIGSSFIINTIKKNNPVLLNSAEELTLDIGNYVVGKKIKSGYYDVKALNDNISFNSIKLSKGDKLINQDLPDQSRVIIEGEGKIRISPASFNSLSLNKNNEYIIQNSGYYLVGEQLKEGKYILSYFTKDNKEINEKPFVQILPSFRSQPSKTFGFEKEKNYNITLTQGNILEIHKTLFEENDNILIKLTPQ